MQLHAALEGALAQALALFRGASGSDSRGLRLDEALDYSVFPAGARLRPRLTLAVADAFAARAVAMPVAVAIELVHTASLVHDDLPCFDDAPLRRGRPSVHRAYGTPTAVLAGDALLATAFRILARVECVRSRELVAQAACELMRGQAQEGEPHVAVATYHEQKTACLFAVAAQAGALAAGQAGAPFAALGRALGRAYQMADDLYDTADAKVDDSKGRGNDIALGRPNIALRLGRQEAMEQMQCTLTDAHAQGCALMGPASTGSAFVEAFARRLLQFADAPSLVEFHAKASAPSARTQAVRRAPVWNDSAQP